MRWVLDLDNTLVQTREAHRLAYMSIGISPPDDFHTRPWQEWCSPENHDRKNRSLPLFLSKHARILPAFKILTTFEGEILTNASWSSYWALVAVFPQLRQYSATIEKSPAEKLEWLLAEQEGSTWSGSPGIYVDDSQELLDQVRRETRWQVLNTSGF